VGCFLAVVRSNVLCLFLIPLWLLKGRAHLKHELARRAIVDAGTLPYHKDFLDFLYAEHRRGRPLVLITASDGSIAQQVADHLGIFNEVMASDGTQNMKGLRKARALQEKFGDKAFDYAGNHSADLKVWDHSNAAIVVNGSDRLVRKTEQVTWVSRVFAGRPSQLAALLRVVRPKHWIKNTLILVPLITSQQLVLPVLANAVFAFVAFSLIASTIYVFNDLVDLAHDRKHHTKKNRPLASGALSLLGGLLTIPALLAAGFLVSAVLPIRFALILCGYVVLNIGYSLHFKHVVLVDVVCLAVFYTLRVLAGAMATSIAPSNWLLAFSAFICLSLAFAKRVIELQHLTPGQNEKAAGRGYVASDLSQLASFGAASGYLAVLVFMLYLDSPSSKQIYSTSEALWTVCPLLLYWISRLWIMIHRHQVAEDPIVFIFKDKVSCVIGLAVALVLLLAN
jgi:4-hydroxybenzoate polyprenyltransferase